MASFNDTNINILQIFHVIIRPEQMKIREDIEEIVRAGFFSLCCLRRGSAPSWEVTPIVRSACALNISSHFQWTSILFKTEGLGTPGFVCPLARLLTLFKTKANSLKHRVTTIRYLVKGRDWYHLYTSYDGY